MTVTIQSTRAVYNGDGATTSWPFSFPLLASADMVVTVTDSSGNATVLDPSVYVISGPFPLMNGGSVLTYSPVDTGSTITLRRAMAYQQKTSITAQSSFNPNILEQALDRLAMQDQQLSDALSAAVTVPLNEEISPLPTAAQRANSIFAFDDYGQPEVLSANTRQGANPGATLVIPNTTYAADTSSIAPTFPLVSIAQFPEGAFIEVSDPMNNAGNKPITIHAASGESIYDHGNVANSHTINNSNTTTRYTKRNGMWRVMQYGG